MTEVGVTVDATASVADIQKGSTKIVRAGDVADYIADVAKAMHFRGLAEIKDGVVTPSDGNTKHVAGDVVITSTGKEYVYTGSKWQELGDETAFGQLSEYAGYNTALTTSAKTLAGAVNELDAAIKGMDSSFTTTADNGVKATLTQTDGKVTAFNVTVDAVEASTGITNAATNVVTASAVHSFVTGTVNGLGSTVSSTASGIGIEVVETSGKLTGASVTVTKADLNTALGLTSFADKTTVSTVSAAATNNEIPTAAAVKSAIDGLNSKITGGSSIASNRGVEVKVVTAATTAAPTVSVSDTAPSTMGMNEHGSPTELATTQAVADYFTNNLVWLSADGSALE